MFHGTPYQCGPPQHRQFSPANNQMKSPPGMDINPFRSPMARPRYQSSPRYQGQCGSPYPDPYRCAPGNIRPQRSPHSNNHSIRSPRNDSSFNSSYDNSYNRRHSGTPHSNWSRGKGRYSGNWDNSGSDHNPGGSDDLRLYYCADMVQDPWSSFKKPSASSSTSSSSS